jgi:DNA-binding CsgD family transcriptional regulator
MQLDRYFEISQASDTKTFESRLIAMAADFGFGLVTAALVIENPADRENYQCISVGNTPEAYLEAIKDKNAVARDPVVKRLRELSIPFQYDQKLYVEDDAIDLWEEQAVFGYKTGLAVALHLPGRRHFLLGVDRDQPLPASSERMMRLMADLQFLAVHAQSAATRLWTSKSALELPKFSTRELEVLKWTQAGKSNWETGVILGLSEDGVRYHWRSILLKLDVPSKHQAVLKALDLGIL